MQPTRAMSAGLFGVAGAASLSRAGNACWSWCVLSFRLSCYMRSVTPTTALFHFNLFPTPFSALQFLALPARFLLWRPTRLPSPLVPFAALGHRSLKNPTNS